MCVCVSECVVAACGVVMVVAVLRCGGTSLTAPWCRRCMQAHSVGSAVHTVRFNHSGAFLATGSDDVRLLAVKSSALTELVRLSCAICLPLCPLGWWAFCNWVPVASSTQSDDDSCRGIATCLHGLKRSVVLCCDVRGCHRALLCVVVASRRVPSPAGQAGGRQRCSDGRGAVGGRAVAHDSQHGPQPALLYRSLKSGT